MAEQSKLDSMLAIVGNPIRRSIIKRLSQEPSYALELAREVGVGQQLATSHLSIMERAGIIASSMKKSPVGPRQKRYFLNQSACISVSFGPHLYDEQFATFDALPSKLSDDATLFLERAARIEKIRESDKIESFSSLLGDIDARLMALENEKGVLLYIRNLVMGQTGEVFDAQKKTHDERRILHYLLDERNRDIEAISRALNLRESVVRDILEKLRGELPAVTNG